MRCHKAREYVSHEMDEHLPPDATVDLTRHLDTCADCREYREDLLLGIRTMKATTPELPENFEWKLQLKLNQAMQQAAGNTIFPWEESDQDKWRWFRNFGAAAAVGMAAVLALAMFLGPVGESSGPVGDLGSGSSGIVGAGTGGAGGSDRLPLFTGEVRRGGLYNQGIQRPVSAGGTSRTSARMFDRGWSGRDVGDLELIQSLRVQNSQLNQQLHVQQQIIQGMRAHLDTVNSNALDLEQE